jgi:hypothetical protein
MSARLIIMVILLFGAVAVMLSIPARWPEPTMTVHAAADDKVEAETRAFGEGIRKLRDTHRYAELDAMAEALRRHDEHFTGGISKLDRFYWALISDALPENHRPSCATPTATPATFEPVHAQLEAWRASYPSLTADIALASFWIGAYDYGRNCDGVWKGTKADWTAITDRATRAVPYLNTVADGSDPKAFWLALRLGEFYGYPRWCLQDIYEAGVARFPEFYAFYGEWTSYLAARWYYRPHLLDVYLQQLRQPERGYIGKVAYAFATNRLTLIFARRQLFNEVGLSFPAVIEAYQLREQHYGLRTHDWNVVFFLSIEALDCETAHTAYLHIGDQWDRSVWGERKYFDQTIAWYHAHSRY